MVRHPAVKQAVVVAREDARGERRLAGYFVPGRARRARGGRPPPLAQGSPARGDGPVVDRSPSTRCRSRSNGKVDRSALPAPAEDDDVASSREHALPRTAAEHRLAAIAAELLGRDRRRHPRQLLRAGHRLDPRHPARRRGPGRRAWPWTRPSCSGRRRSPAWRRPRRVERGHADEPTLATEPFALMPEWLDRGALERTFAAEGGIDDVYPLTPVQAGMLFHTLADPEAGHYVEQFTCGLRGDLDLPALREAWRRLDRAASRPAVHDPLGRSRPSLPGRPSARRRPWSSTTTGGGWRTSERRERLAAFLASDRRTRIRPVATAAVAAGTRPDRPRSPSARLEHPPRRDRRLVPLGPARTRPSTPTRPSAAARSPPAADPAVPGLRRLAPGPGRAGGRGVLADVPCAGPPSRRRSGSTAWARPSRVARSSDIAEREIALEPAASSALQDLARSRRLHAQHPDPGRVGALAGPLQRSVRRRLRGDRVRAAPRAGRASRRWSACSSTRCRSASRSTSRPTWSPGCSGSRTASSSCAGSRRSRSRGSRAGARSRPGRRCSRAS